jgi:low molecular weight protein-tyrosine phosphatase
MPSSVSQWMRRFGKVIASPAERENSLHEWRRRRRGEPDLPAGPIRQVLVVCLGNICRSPFAAGLLASRHPELAVRSGGLLAGGGRRADVAARRSAARFGVDLGSHASHSVVAQDVDWADLVLAMEGHHWAELARCWPHERPKLRVLGDFLSEPPYTIHDPWGLGQEVFDLTFQRIEAAVRRISAKLEARGRECPGGS